MSSLIELKSPEGQRLLQQVRGGGGVCQPLLMAVFCKQTGMVNCGIQSAALVLGAWDIGQKEPISVEKEIVIDKANLKYTEAKMFDFQETLSVADQDQVHKMDGLTLDQLYDILIRHNKKTEKYYCNESSVDVFRQKAMDALSHVDSTTAVIVNYHMATLGQSPTYGHHSPLAAYHKDTDRFLVMDVWGATEECWATTASLFAAMNTVDDASDKYRGYCIIPF